MSTIYVMVGIPGSGKTTYAKELAEKNNAVLLSSDDIREELFGDANIQADPRLVFGVMYERTVAALLYGTDVVYDATNIHTKDRTRLLSELPKSTHCCAIYMNTPLSVCLARNAKRERQVPRVVIDKMYKNLCVPDRSEGFEKIISVSSDVENE